MRFLNTFKLRLIVIAGLASLGACTTVQLPPSQPETDPSTGTVTVPASKDKESRPKGKLQPIPVTPINLSTSCQINDGLKTTGTMQAELKQSKVLAFSADLAIAGKGMCQFNLSQFHQTDTLPIVKLKSNTTACQVFMWTQYDNVTVAFNQCQSQCTGNAFDYLWPILVDGNKGECS